MRAGVCGDKASNSYEYVYAKISATIVRASTIFYDFTGQLSSPTKSRPSTRPVANIVYTQRLVNLQWIIVFVRKKTQLQFPQLNW